jgi:hypothetical protein
MGVIIFFNYNITKSLVLNIKNKKIYCHADKRMEISYIIMKIFLKFKGHSHVKVGEVFCEI